MYVLNRLKFTGKLNENTPRCVVLEILQAHSICIYKSIDTISEHIKEIERIENYRTDSFDEPLKSTDLRKLATFVNFNCSSWTKTSLVKAYTHMCNFDRKNIAGIIFGQKTNEQIYNYNACMMYVLCKEYSIDTYWNMTQEQMIVSLKKLSLSLSSLRSQLETYVLQMDKSIIINVLNKFKTSSLSENIVNDAEQKPMDFPPLIELDLINISQSYTKISASNYALQFVTPKCHSDAVILAALVYSVNLSDVKNPYLEYFALRESGSKMLYTPVDSEFREIYTTNISFFDLDILYEPSLSCMYDIDRLKHMCFLEGYTVNHLNGHSYEDLLQKTRVSFNVYPGKNGYKKEEDTPIMLESIKDLSNSECITFGKLETKELTTFSVKEIIQLFNSERVFKNPLDMKQILEERVVNKISSYAEKIHSIELLTAIENVKKWQIYTTDVTTKLRDVYNSNLYIKEMLYKILDAGMYMRGWKISSENYPLNETETITLENNQQVETNVNTSINDIFELMEKYPLDIQDELFNLPLMRYMDLEKEFIVSPDKDDGKSIFERLDFVRQGFIHKNMKSCIRVSSNIILSSIYYYICALNLPEPFNISELQIIS